MIGRIKDVFLISAPSPIRLVVCVEPPASAAQCAAMFYDPEKDRTILVPEPQDIEHITDQGKSFSLLDGEEAMLEGELCHAVTLLYDHYN